MIKRYQPHWPTGTMSESLCGDLVYFDDHADCIRKLEAALADTRFKLANINRICAEAPPCDELDEDGELYDSILNAIQRWTRAAPAGADEKILPKNCIHGEPLGGHCWYVGPTTASGKKIESMNKSITSLKAIKLRNQAWLDRGDAGSLCAIDRQHLLCLVRDLEEVFRHIAEGKGRFNLDHKLHAINTIEDMKALANGALAHIEVQS